MLPVATVLLAIALSDFQDCWHRTLRGRMRSWIFLPVLILVAARSMAAGA